MPSYSAQSDELHYDERGTGDRVVVLGGGPARHPDYLGDLGGVARQRTLVVPFLRGVRPSPFPEDTDLGSWWHQSADVEALRVHLGLGRVTVIGHSAGTRIALAYAARFPASLDRLVLIAPPASDLVAVASDVPEIRRRHREPAFEAALAKAQQGPPAVADDDRLTMWQQAIAPLSYAEWGPAQQAHARIGSWSAAAVRVYGSVDPPGTFRADLAGVTAPVRVVAGAEDGITGLAGPLALAELFPDGLGSAVAGAGHYPWIDRPADFATAMEDALTR